MLMTFKPKLHQFLLSLFIASCFAFMSSEANSEYSTKPTEEQLTDDQNTPALHMSNQPSDISQDNYFDSLADSTATAPHNFIADMGKKTDGVAKTSGSQMPTKATAAGDWGAL